jgi:hypothetical protein
MSSKLVSIWGVHRARETPDPIPNSEVKPRIGDGTAGATLWESSTMPLFFYSRLITKVISRFFFARESFFKFLRVGDSWSLIC